MNASECVPLYDFESAIENAVQSVLITNEIDAYNTQSAPVVDEERPRPRVEVAFQCGPATGHRNPNLAVYHTDAYIGNCSLAVVTNTNDADANGVNAGARAHAIFRAMVRYIGNTIESTFTDDAAAADTLLPYHSVNRFVESGSSPSNRTEDGLLVTVINYEVHFNIRPAAWPA